VVFTVKSNTWTEARDRSDQRTRALQVG